MKATKKLTAETRRQLAHDMLIASKDGYRPIGDVKREEYKSTYTTYNGRFKDEYGHKYYAYMQKDVEL